MDETASKRRRAAFAVAAVATVVVCVLTVPMMLVGVYAVTTDEASAPKVGAVPRPDGWAGRRLETAACSASGGEFCTLVVLSPTPGTSRAGAESGYRDYLVRARWTRVVDGDQLVFQQGRRGEETIIGVGSDDRYAYSARTHGVPARDTDIVVRTWFADDGAARSRSIGLKLIWVAAAITLAPAAVFAVRSARSGDHAAESRRPTSSRPAGTELP